MTRTVSVPALEPVEAWRVVAKPAAVDAARWLGDDVDVLRIAPDEALGLGATGVEIDGDPDAIAEREAGYIATGNTGRNTTIIRSNYAVPEAIRFYDHSRQLYAGLEAETGAAIFHRVKGHVWIAHTEMALRTERARVLMNQAMGVDTELLDPAGVKRLIPQIDLTGGGRYPVLGASHHVPAATARHDRVAWAFASGATSRGTH